MTRQAPIEPAKNFNLNKIKKSKDKKTEYIVAKKTNGIKPGILAPLHRITMGKLCFSTVKKREKVPHL